MLTEKIDDMKNILLIALCSLLFGMSAAAQISKRLVRANKIEAASALSVPINAGPVRLSWRVEDY